MLRVLADECIHQDIIKALKEEGFDVATVDDAHLRGVSDDSVFNFSTKTKRILLSFDREFGNFFKFDIKNSGGVVIILINQMNKGEIIKNTLIFFKNIKQTNLKGKLVIIGKTKLRIRNF